MTVRGAFVRQTSIAGGPARRAGHGRRPDLLNELRDRLGAPRERAQAPRRRAPRRGPKAAWQNFPPDLPYFTAYFVAHEAHHRGQLCLIARQLGHRLPPEITGGIWGWRRLSRSR